MKPRKSLGQIAYEAGHPARENWQSWAELGPRFQEQHARMALAVARAVRKREKKRK